MGTEVVSTGGKNLIADPSTLYFKSKDNGKIVTNVTSFLRK
jgi:hypothetical protein